MAIEIKLRRVLQRLRHLDPQPRSRTTLAGPLPSATRCALMGCPSSALRSAPDSALTTAAVCAASGLPSSGFASCRNAMKPLEWL